MQELRTISEPNLQNTDLSRLVSPILEDLVPVWGPW
jgi:hypothetical protein